MLSLTKDHRVFSFSGEAEPALTVRAGTVVRLETADCFDEQVRAPGDVLDAIDLDRVNPATGPVYVDGAHPGDVLSVLVESIDVGRQGVMVVSPEFGVLRDRVPGAGAPHRAHRGWDGADRRAASPSRSGP